MAPWATIIQPPSTRNECDTEVREKVERLEQELRSVAMQQMKSDELVHTRQRLHDVEGTVQLQQKEAHEARELSEELRSQLSQRDLNIQEVEQRLLQDLEEHDRTKMDLQRARYDFDCAVVSKEQLEVEHRSYREHTEALIEQMTQERSELRRSEEELQQQLLTLSGQKSTLEAQVGERERELSTRLALGAEATRRLQGEKVELEAELERERELSTRLASAAEATRRLQGEKVELETELEQARRQQRETERETRELRCRTAVLEDQLRGVQDQTARTDRDEERAGEDVRQWYQKFIESNKENAMLQQTAQEQRRELWDLEGQLRQERNVANIVTPGEFLKLMKAHEDESLAVENARLKKALVKMRCDLDLCVRKLGDQENRIKEHGLAPPHA